MSSIAPEKHKSVESRISEAFDLIKQFNNDHRNKSSINLEAKCNTTPEGSIFELEVMLFSADDIVSQITELKSTFVFKINDYNDHQLLQAKQNWWTMTDGSRQLLRGIKYF